MAGAIIMFEHDRAGLGWPDCSRCLSMMGRDWAGQIYIIFEHDGAGLGWLMGGDRQSLCLSMMGRDWDSEVIYHV